MNTATKLDDFTRAYIECLLWVETDNSNEQGGRPLEDNYSLDDIAPEALAAIVEDCQRFQDANRADIDEYPARKRCADGQEYTGAELAGHDYWLTRNGHGAGFWCRDYLPEIVGERLTQAAKTAGQVWAYVGDDGLIYLS